MLIEMLPSKSFLFMDSIFFEFLWSCFSMHLVYFEWAYMCICFYSTALSQETQAKCNGHNKCPVNVKPLDELMNEQTRTLGLEAENLQVSLFKSSVIFIHPFTSLWYGWVSMPVAENKLVYHYSLDANIFLPFLK